jgi:arsenite-transporting ATPase
VFNNSLAAADPTSTLFRLRAIGVLPQIEKVKKEYGTRLAMVPMLPTEPVGIPAWEALNRTRVTLTRWGPAIRAEGDPVDDG